MSRTSITRARWFMELQRIRRRRWVVHHCLHLASCPAPAAHVRTICDRTGRISWGGQRTAEKWQDSSSVARSDLGTTERSCCDWGDTRWSRQVTADQAWDTTPPGDARSGTGWPRSSTSVVASPRTTGSTTSRKCYSRRDLWCNRPGPGARRPRTARERTRTRTRRGGSECSGVVHRVRPREREPAVALAYRSHRAPVEERHPAFAVPQRRPVDALDIPVLGLRDREGRVR
jgi:hypothetical protein